MRRLSLLFAAAVLAAGAVGCADLKAVTSLATALQNEYHVPVNVNVNRDGSGAHLVLLFAQFPQSKLGPDERAAFARDVARFARAHYAGAAQLTDVRIGSVKRSGAGPVSFTETSVPYRFTMAELDDSTAVPDAAPAADAATDSARR